VVVYPGAPQSATHCPSQGCWCHDRVPRYPSDLSDDQCKVLEPQARAVMRERVIAAGRPMAHDLRAMVGAIACVARNGIEWRATPAGFPPWDSVYAFYQRWNARSLPQGLVTRLRGGLAFLLLSEPTLSRPISLSNASGLASRSPGAGLHRRALRCGCPAGYTRVCPAGHPQKILRGMWLAGRLVLGHGGRRPRM
jgi:transposase